MEDPSLGNEGSQTSPAVPAPPRKSGWRIAAGILVSIVTLLVTLVLGFLSLCFGMMLKSSSGFSSSDSPWIFGLFAVTILVPIGGTWLAVRLFRGPKASRVAGAGAMAASTAAAPVPVTRTSAKEIEEQLAYLRLVILVAILAHAALLVLNFSRYRNVAYRGWLLISIVNFVLYQIPYAVVLIGIRSRAQRWALSLALMFSILSLCFTTFNLLFVFGPWRYSGSLAPNPALYLLGPVVNVVVIVFAWRAWWAAGRGSDDAVQLVVWGVASAVYLLLLHGTSGLFYRLVHF